MKAKEGFATALDNGREVIVARGDHLREDHELVKRNPQLFEHVESRHELEEDEEPEPEPEPKPAAKTKFAK